MMGKAKDIKPKLFYGISLEQKVPADHPLRKIKKAIDFSFVRKRVAGLYGARGNTSIDPAVIMKLIFLLFLENVKSERQLAAQLPLRMDWLWFCDYDLDDETPDHSVLSKARKRWGREVFAEFFQIVLDQCIEAGLVDGEIIHIDSTTITADASKDHLRPQIHQLSDRLYEQLDDQDKVEDNSKSQTEVKPADAELCQRASQSDPDARLATKNGKTTLGYKDHRVVDDAHGIITATVTTPANVNDGKVLEQAIETHESNTHKAVETVVADKAYGTLDNYRYLQDKGAMPCIDHARYHSSGQSREFQKDRFVYDEVRNCYICPAGEKLEFTGIKGSSHGKHYAYEADRKVCEQCQYFSECVKSKSSGRQISEQLDMEYSRWADGCFTSAERCSLRQKRMARSEGSFADGANNHGLKRCRWRTLIKAEIQNLLIAAVQNVRKLITLAGVKKAQTAANSVLAAISTLILAQLLHLLRNPTSQTSS